MENQRNLSKSVLIVGIVTVLLLAVPLVAMQFTTDVDWSVSDFIMMGTLIFGTGVSFVFVMKRANNFVYRFAMLIAFGTTFLMIWANLAVGLIGSGPNAGNLSYIAVVALAIIGTYLSRFTSRGMEFVMFGSALAVVLVTVVALVTNMQDYPGSSVIEIIGVGSFFATLYAISGLLFRFISLESAEKSAA